MALGAAFLANEHNAIVTSLPALQDIASMSILCSVRSLTIFNYIVTCKLFLDC